MTAARRLRGGLIGYGHVAAQAHAPVWRDRGVQIVAAADASPSRRKQFLRDHPGGRAYADAAALFAAGAVDFVDICTPPDSHAGLVEGALAAGLDVLCEKPLTIADGDAARIAAAAERSGRVVHVVHNWLAAPLCRKVSALVGEGAVGQVRSVDWRTLRTRPAVAVAAAGDANWRLDPAIAGGGILMDHGWHAAYCVAHWAGGAPRRVSGRLESRRFLDLGVEDTATVELDYGAATGRIFLTWAADERANTLTVEGDLGRIEVVGADVTLEDERGVRRWACPPALSEGSHHPDWFAAVIDGFVGAVEGRHRSNLDEALMCARVMRAAKQSDASDGAWVDAQA